jgi:hypothetical protein
MIKTAPTILILISMLRRKCVAIIAGIIAAMGFAGSAARAQGADQLYAKAKDEIGRRRPLAGSVIADGANCWGGNS